MARAWGASFLFVFVGATLGCGFDASGRADEPGADDGSVVADSTLDVDGDSTSEVAIDTCIPEAGSACNSPGLCFTGTVECDGRCNAPPDPPAFATACTTPKGCAGKFDCDGNCIGEPLATGSACTTANGCSGKQACDGSCVGDPPNFGKTCATPKGCTAKYDCGGKCPESSLVDKSCKTTNGCDRKTDCAGKCNEDPSYGKPCTTAKGCAKTLNCDLKCPGDDPKVGTACNVSGCSNGVWDCSLVCKLPAGANEPCTSATCGVATKKDCMGVCPDPTKPSAFCYQCNCPGGKKDVYSDTCGNCPTCASFACGSGDAGPDDATAPDAATGG